MNFELITTSFDFSVHGQEGSKIAFGRNIQSQIKLMASDSDLPSAPGFSAHEIAWVRVVQAGAPAGDVRHFRLFGMTRTNGVKRLCFGQEGTPPAEIPGGIGDATIVSQFGYSHVLNYDRQEFLVTTMTEWK